MLRLSVARTLRRVNQVWQATRSICSPAGVVKVPNTPQEEVTGDRQGCKHDVREVMRVKRMIDK